MLERLPQFQSKANECLQREFFALNPRDNFLMSEQLHVHQATETCQHEYNDVIDFWLNSLFNFLEDGFEESQFEVLAKQSLWHEMATDEWLETQRHLLQKFQNSIPSLGPLSQTVDAYRMLDSGEILAFVTETSSGYISLFWRAKQT